MNKQWDNIDRAAEAEGVALRTKAMSGSNSWTMVGRPHNKRNGKRMVTYNNAVRHNDIMLSHGKCLFDKLFIPEAKHGIKNLLQRKTK